MQCLENLLSEPEVYGQAPLPMNEALLVSICSAATNGVQASVRTLVSVLRSLKPLLTSSFNGLEKKWFLCVLVGLLRSSRHERLNELALKLSWALRRLQNIQPTFIPHLFEQLLGDQEGMYYDALVARGEDIELRLTGSELIRYANSLVEEALVIAEEEIRVASPQTLDVDGAQPT
ncbi:MAG: hypothetical protein ACRDAM_09320, partial [Casimicrobium sp.]